MAAPIAKALTRSTFAMPMAGSCGVISRTAHLDTTRRTPPKAKPRAAARRGGSPAAPVLSSEMLSARPLRCVMCRRSPHSIRRANRRRKRSTRNARRKVLRPEEGPIARQSYTKPQCSTRELYRAEPDCRSLRRLPRRLGALSSSGCPTASKSPSQYAMNPVMTNSTTSVSDFMVPGA
jgi:hypothetical protein